MDYLHPQRNEKTSEATYKERPSRRQVRGERSAQGNAAAYRTQDDRAERQCFLMHEQRVT
jgi:hypothetical protein